MTLDIYVESGKIVIEGDIPKSDTARIPAIGSAFFVPDTLGFVQRVKTFTWTASEHDWHLLYNNKVFTSKEAALSRYDYEMSLSSVVDNA